MSSKAGAQSQKQGSNKQKQAATKSQIKVTPAQPQKEAAGNNSPAQTPSTRAQAIQQRQAAAKSEAGRRKRRVLFQRAGIVATLVVAVGAVVAYFMIQAANMPGQYVAMQASRPHVSPGEAHPAYTTDPPTSGPHFDQVPQFIVYTQPLTTELQVHGLEDGAAVVNYRPDLDKTTVERLTSLVDTYYTKQDPNPGDPNVQHPERVILAPYNFKDPNDVIVLTAWQRIDKMPAYDETRIRRFLDAYAGWDSHAKSAVGPNWTP